MYACSTILHNHSVISSNDANKNESNDFILRCQQQSLLLFSLCFFFDYGLTLAHFWKIKFSVSGLKTRTCLVCSCEVSASILAEECTVVVTVL